MASVLAWSSVKLPEICTWPLNDEKEDCVGWVIGAETTCPSRSIPMMAWNCSWASASHCLAPWLVSTMLTAHWPLTSWAVAERTAVPVTVAGPST